MYPRQYGLQQTKKKQRRLLSRTDVQNTPHPICKLNRAHSTQAREDGTQFWRKDILASYITWWRMLLLTKYQGNIYASEHGNTHWAARERKSSRNHCSGPLIHCQVNRGKIFLETISSDRFSPSDKDRVNRRASRSTFRFHFGWITSKQAKISIQWNCLQAMTNCIKTTLQYLDDHIST